MSELTDNFKGEKDLEIEALRLALKYEKGYSDLKTNMIDTQEDLINDLKNEIERLKKIVS